MKDAYKELQTATLIVSVMLHAGYKEQFAIKLKENAMNVIQSRTQNVHKLKGHVTQIAQNMTTLIHYAIEKQANARNVKLIQLNQVAYQMLLVRKLAQSLHHMISYMNVTGPKQILLVIK